MNVRDLKNIANAITSKDLQKLKGGFGDPPPIGPAD